eukprot:5576029-Prymnesium_polylepis.1
MDGARRSRTRTSEAAARTAREQRLVDVHPTALAASGAAGVAGAGLQRAAVALAAAATPARQKRPAAAPRGVHTAAYEKYNERTTPKKPTHTSVLTKANKVKATRSDGERPARRGELDGIHCNYNGIADFSEFYQLCSELDNSLIKKSEINELHNRGKISTSWSTVK